MLAVCSGLLLGAKGTGWHGRYNSHLGALQLLIAPLWRQEQEQRAGMQFCVG